MTGLSLWLRVTQLYTLAQKKVNRLYTVGSYITKKVKLPSP